MSMVPDHVPPPHTHTRDALLGGRCCSKYFCIFLHTQLLLKRRQGSAHHRPASLGWLTWKQQHITVKVRWSPQLAPVAGRKERLSWSRRAVKETRPSRWDQMFTVSLEQMRTLCVCVCVCVCECERERERVCV